MLKFFLQPYPLDTDIRKNLIINALIGCFIAFFLIFFQPFNTDEWQDPHKTIKLIGYGVIAFVVPMILFFALYFSDDRDKIEDKWNVWKEVFFMSLMIMLIAIVNVFYSYYVLGFGRLNFEAFFNFVIVVLALGIFPIMASILVKYNRYKTMNEAEAADISKNLHDYQEKNQTTILSSEEKVSEMITLVAENEKDTISLNINDLLYVESADNYSNIVFLKNNKVVKELLRGSMKRFESQLNHPLVYRCHRSFIINLSQVDSISGNAQGYRMTLKKYHEIIPVARNYGATILAQLKTQNQNH